jgi:hypothetical protein
MTTKEEGTDQVGERLLLRGGRCLFAPDEEAESDSPSGTRHTSCERALTIPTFFPAALASLNTLVRPICIRYQLARLAFVPGLS